ncbi:MAG: ABC transporter ATP-binding protein [Bacilli bacterium]|nr:ABC transporter ATP-binding protein [Bacilli bacterium]
MALTIGPLIKLIEAFFDLLIPLFMKAIIDLNQYGDPSVIPNQFSQKLGSFIRLFGTWIPDNQSLNDAIIGGTIILVMGVIGFAFTMLTQYIAARTAMNVGTEVRECLYEKIISLSKKDREKFGNGRLMTSLNSDSYQIQQAILFFVRLVVRSPAIILGSLIFSFILDWRIGLAFIALVPTLLIVIFLVLGQSSKKYTSIQEALDDISTKSNDDINGARVIRAFNRQSEETESFGQTTSNYQNKSINVHKINSLINPIVFASTALITILIVFLVRGTLLNDTDAEKVVISSTIIAEMAYLAQIFFAVTQLPPVLLDIIKGGVARKRINQILSLEPSITSGNKINDSFTDGDIIAFKNVYFSYKESSDHYALNDLTFTLKKNQTLGVIGGTGSGKSTIINLVERFYDASKGEVEYKGINVKDYDLSSLRKEIGLVNQKSRLFKGTIKSNFLMANPNISDEEIEIALKQAEAYEFVSKYDDYLNHEVVEGGNNFSGGQRQRLCIARALAKKSELLVFDDSTSALDLLTDKKIREHLKEMKDITKIIISQRVATISDADQIIVLDKGFVVGIGTHEQLLKNCDIYKEIYETQIQKG